MSRTDRKARNQALFRSVNERIAEVASGFGVTTAQAFVCECSRIGCAEMLVLDPATYGQVRDDPTTFVVVPGHEDPGHEVVLAGSDRYVVVRNGHGEAERVGRETADDPGAVSRRFRR